MNNDHLDLALDVMVATAQRIKEGDKRPLTKASYELARDIAKGLVENPFRKITPVQREFLETALVASEVHT